MKTTAIKIGILAALSFCMVLLNGCKKEAMSLSNNNDNARATSAIKQSPHSGALGIKMTNTSHSPFGAVNVEIVALSVFYENKKVGDFGWINLPLKPKIYNLTQWQDGLETMLASSNTLPAGKISQVRLVLGPQNSVAWADQDGRHFFPLALTNYMTPVNVDVTITEELSAFLTLDFNAAGSVNFEGNNEGNSTYLLSPDLRAQSVEYE